MGTSHKSQTDCTAVDLTELRSQRPSGKQCNLSTEHHFNPGSGAAHVLHAFYLSPFVGFQTTHFCFFTFLAELDGTQGAFHAQQRLTMKRTYC